MFAKYKKNLFVLTGTSANYENAVTVEAIMGNDWTVVPAGSALWDHQFDNIMCMPPTTGFERGYIEKLHGHYKNIMIKLGS